MLDARDVTLGTILAPMCGDEGRAGDGNAVHMSWPVQIKRLMPLFPES
jgi:hypothetical protein